MMFRSRRPQTSLLAMVIIPSLCTAGLAAKPDPDSRLRLAAQPDPGALKAAGDAAASTLAGGIRLSQTTVFASQSFRIIDHGELAGTLVSGRGTLPALSPDAETVNTCFALLAIKGKRPTLVLTVGSGAWETEGCAGVAAVGMLPGGGPDYRIALVYKATAPHATTLEPVVLKWSMAQALAIDGAASKRASLAGATTLAAIQSALARP